MTPYKLLWLDRTVTSLEQIRSAIEDVSQSEDIALRIIKSIYKGAQQLKKFPRMAPEINEITGLRCLVIGNYYIFYRVIEEKRVVQIERIMDQRQDTSFLV